MLLFLLSNWRLISAGVLLIGAFLGGIHVESGHRDAQDAARERATAAAFAVEVKRGKEAAGALLADKADLQAKADELQRRYDEKKGPTKYVLVKGAPAQFIPSWLITGYDVGVWNAALCAGLESGNTCRTVVAPEPTDVTEATGITKDEVMKNLIANAKSCNSDRKQLEKLESILK